MLFCSGQNPFFGQIISLMYSSLLRMITISRTLILEGGVETHHVINEINE